MNRKEHPKPQFMREGWKNLNGAWRFRAVGYDNGKGPDREEGGTALPKEINVPFCPESRLSGIGYTGFIYEAEYEREFLLTEEELSGRVRLHFGAVDYRAEVSVNGKACGTHTGGYTSFYFDVSECVRAGSNTVTVRVQDDTANPLYPSGKQSHERDSFGCFYTRTTGIWQTVWLEFLPETHIENFRCIPSVREGTVTVHARLSGSATLCVEAFYEGVSVGKASATAAAGEAVVTLSLSEKHLWEVGKGRLYGLVLSYGKDRVESYFGLREISLKKGVLHLNGSPVFQRLVLDQGFFPDGIYTAPNDGALAADILRAQEIGFNGARLHEKVFEERFLYHCDRLGYLVWEEFPDWGLNVRLPESADPALSGWREMIDRDFNHPSIIGWCTFNETPPDQDEGVIRKVFSFVKEYDGTRPCIDVSGFHHVQTDVYDVHDYEQDPVVFAKRYGSPEALAEFVDMHSQSFPYDKAEAMFVSEYGGVCRAQTENGWGYGKAPVDDEDLLRRVQGLTEALLKNPKISGFCYTQLTDVEQEKNGLYTYERELKFPAKRLRAIFGGEAAVEKNHKEN